MNSSALACITLVLCSVPGTQIDLALKKEDPATVFADDKITEAFAQRVSEYADRATSYCFCLARWQTDTARGISVSSAPACGDVPEFESLDR